MDTYTGKIVEYDVEIKTYQGYASAQRCVLDRGRNGLIIVENIFNKYRDKAIRITVEEV